MTNIGFGFAHHSSGVGDRRRRNVVGVLVVAIGMLGALCIDPHRAFAATNDGVLWIRGPGLAYTSPDASVSESAALGGSASYSVEVVNTGQTRTQYNLRIVDNTGPGSTATLRTGLLNVTSPASSTSGYVTSPIPAHSAEAFTLRVTLPKTAGPIPFFGELVQLADLDTNQLDVEEAITTVKNSTATGGAAQFVSTLGTAATSPGNKAYSYITAPSIIPGTSARYTVKLENATAAPTGIGYNIIELPAAPEGACYTNPDEGAFPITVKAGSANVTAAVLAGDYVTAPLAHGKSVTLTVSVAYPTVVGACREAGYEGMSYTETTGDAEGMIMVTNLATALF